MSPGILFLERICHHGDTGEKALVLDDYIIIVGIITNVPLSLRSLVTKFFAKSLNNT